MKTTNHPVLALRPFVLACVVAIVTVLAAPAARASIVTIGNFETGTPTPTFTIGTPITISITASGSFAYLGLDEWVTNDGNENYDPPSPADQTISYRINGGPVLTLGVDYLIDNFSATYDSATPNDGFLVFSTAVAVTATQTVTILPGSLTFGSAGTIFNAPPAVFNGNVYLANSSFYTLSPLASANQVPEPSTWALLGVGAGVLGVALRERRSRAG